MFWNVTFIYNAFIRTTDHGKVQTAFVSLFYIFINMKPWNASNSLVIVGGLLLIMQISKLFHWKTTPTRAFNEFLFVPIFTNFFNFGKFVKIRDFFCWGNEFSIYDGKICSIMSKYNARRLLNSICYPTRIFSTVVGRWSMRMQSRITPLSINLIR